MGELFIAAETFPRSAIIANLAIPSRSWYAVNVEIPLRFRKDSAGRLVYSIPLWYRIVTAIMLAAIVAALLTSGGSPSIVAWIILVLLVFGLLYEERWIADPAKAVLRHSGGIWPIVKTTSLDFSQLEGFRLSAFARGTVQGSEEERKEEARAYAMMEGRDKPETGVKSFLSMGQHKPYIHLIADAKEARAFLVDSLPARKASRLKKVGAAFAEACGTEFGIDKRSEDIH